MTADRFPRYAELPVLGDTGDHHAWTTFGERDELGTMNFVGAEEIRAASRTVTEGRIVNLALPLDVPRPGLGEGRPGFEHLIERRAWGSDDRLDCFFLQCSSQWDALAHIRYREHGYYGGRTEQDLDDGALGIDVLARKGIVGRGVLVDFAGWRSDTGSPVDGARRHAITPQELERALQWSATSLEPGDIVLVRTGWLRWYLGLDARAREALGGRLTGEHAIECPGLAAGADMAAWLWDHRVAAVAADNPALEALQVRRDEGFLHRRILALLGMPIGELWYLEKLAQACAGLRRHHFLLTSAPLNLPRGVGSPNNAYAVL